MVTMPFILDLGSDAQAARFGRGVNNSRFLNVPVPRLTSERKKDKNLQELIIKSVIHRTKQHYYYDRGLAVS